MEPWLEVLLREYSQGLKFGTMTWGSTKGIFARFKVWQSLSKSSGDKKRFNLTSFLHKEIMDKQNDKQSYRSA